MRTGMSIILGLTVVVFLATGLAAQESYEDYRTTDKGVSRDRPLSEIRPGETDNLLDDLRGAVRDEIDKSISRERREKRKTINKDKLINDVKGIVKEEIEDAIKLKSKTYLAFGTMEAGGFISMQTFGLEASAQDYNFIIKVFPIFYYFVHKNVGVGIKGESEFNLTTGAFSFNVGVGPQFVFGLGPREEVCLYTAIFLGVSMVNETFGWRFSNEIGVKIILTQGVLLNIGVQLAFDTGGTQVTGFENVIVPGVGITAYF